MLGEARLVEVLAAGLQTSVQDARGRPGFQRYGIAAGGAMDRFAARAANLLVGNPPDAALLEITLAGPALHFTAPTAFALTGADLGATLRGRRLEAGWSYLARAESELEFGARRHGVRAYLAFAGGIQVPEVLGSRSTDPRAGFGGHEGRALRPGDRLLLGPSPDPLLRAGRSLRGAGAPPEEDAVRLLPGPHADRFAPGTLDLLVTATWTIGPRADRMGARLQGPALEHRAAPDVTSLGLPVGAIQVPGDGQPIVLLADHQPTGGYAVIATVIHADVRLVAQRGPGAPVRFAWTDEAVALAALRAQHTALRLVSPNDSGALLSSWSG